MPFLLAIAALLSVTASAQTLNTFSPDTIADPGKVNENFETLLNTIKNQQRVGDPVAINCTSDTEALLTAISEGASYIEITGGKCSANTGPIGDDIPILGDLYIKGTSFDKVILNTRTDGGSGFGTKYFGGRTGYLILDNVAVSGAVVLIGSASSLVALDTDFSCDSNTIGVYLNGGSGALVRSTVSQCDMGIVADTNAVLNLNDTNITLPKPAADYYPVGIVMRQGASAVLLDSEIITQAPDSGSHVSLAASIQSADLKLVDTRSSGNIFASRFSTVTIENDLNNDSDDVVFAPGVGQAVNTIQLSEGSSVYARNIQFLNTTIRSSHFEASTSAFLYGLSGLNHTNLTVQVGQELVLNGPWQGTNLNASIGETGTISVHNASTASGGVTTFKNQFSFTNALGAKSVLHVTSTGNDAPSVPTSFPDTNICRSGFEAHNLVTASATPQNALLECRAP
jgi:hypothetical protein